MKRFLILFITVFALCSTSYSQTSDLTKITSDYQTLVDINIGWFDFPQNELTFKTEGMCFIKYEDFGSAGNFLTIRYKLDEFADGKEIVKKFEDIIFAKDDEGSYIIFNKYKETILILINNNEEYCFYIKNKMMLMSD